MNRTEELNEIISRYPSFSRRFSNRILSLLLTSEGSSRNIAVSPSRLQAVITMLANWAVPEVCRTMLDSIGCEDMGLQEANALLSRRNLVSCIEDGSYGAENQPVVEQQVSIWAQKSLTVDPSSVDGVVEDYNVSVRNVDFRDPSTKEIIDRAIGEATHGLIEHLDAELSADTLAAIIDILYFKARWWSQFDEYDTKDRLFYGTDGKSMVKMMKQTGTYDYAETSSCQMISLPYMCAYDSKVSFSMVIYLPRGRHTIEDVLKERQSADFKTDFVSTDVALSLPRFSISSRIDMKELLGSLGLGFIFENRNLIPKCIRDLMVSQVIQQVKVNVKENGTEAAAMTYVCMVAGCCPDEEEPKPIVMKVNKPFLFEIIEDSSCTVMFAGVVNNILD